jgi:septal ring factor EnvC (AmiA/AmiB activator)
MVRRCIICLSLALAAEAALAEPRGFAEAKAAAESLRAAIDALDDARRAKDRVAALTHTIGAYEDGLAVLREGLRQVAVAEREATARLEAKRDEVARLLGVMTALGGAGEPTVLFHPDGPEATVRAGMVLSSVAPAVQAEADALRAELTGIAAIRALREEASATLQAGLEAAQTARTELSEAIQDRTDLPQRFLEDPEELKALVAAADTLDGFAEGLGALEEDIGAPMEDFAGSKGSLPLPVRGRVLRQAGEADAAGIVRPGMVIATLPGAIVTTPWPATVRYRGPLLDYGNVMIVEPAEGYLLILAGLDEVYGAAGDVLRAGAPVGLMPGGSGGAALTGAGAEDGGGAERAETLYMELRLGGETVDPAPWFIETRKD